MMCTQSFFKALEGILHAVCETIIRKDAFLSDTKCRQSFSLVDSKNIIPTGMWLKILYTETIYLMVNDKL